MTNAWIQRLLTLGTPIFWWSLAYILWPQHGAWVWACFAMPALIAPALIAIQFIALYSQNQHDPAPQARTLQFFAAWWGEVRACATVFNWWQPFCRAAIADNLSPTMDRHGVVLVHGFFCNRGFWTRWMRRLHAEGRVFVAVDLEPAFGSMDHYIATIDLAVRQVRDATGLPPVLIGHSMGGLAIRAWLVQAGRENPQGKLAHKVITLGSPHHGTWWGHFAHTVNGVQMQLQSAWIAALELDEKPRQAVEFVCFYSNCDNIVFPVSTAKLAGADNRLVPARGHVDMAFDPAVVNACWTLMQ